MKLILMGDSTMQYNDASTYPQVGWGQMLSIFFNNEIEIVNYAKNGCSTKSFCDLGIFDKAINDVSKDTYVFIQFGHNDQKKDNPLRYTDSLTTYPQNLKMFIKRIREKGGIPILLTSVYRRFFDDNHIIKDNVHLDYPEAMMKVAKEEDVVCLDICSKTKKVLSDLGDQASQELFMIFPTNKYKNYLNGLFDNTHLRSDGAYMVCQTVVESLKEIDHPLAKYLI